MDRVGPLSITNQLLTIIIRRLIESPFPFLINPEIPTRTLIVILHFKTKINKTFLRSGLYTMIVLTYDIRIVILPSLSLYYNLVSIFPNETPPQGMTSVAHTIHASSIFQYSILAQYMLLSYHCVS